MNDSKVSIIIPVYNSANYLPMALDSLAKQSYKNIEIICVDDGSTDNSVNIIKKYLNKDGRIKLYCQKNLHAGVARNTGLSFASGEFVIFLDSDDVFSRNMVSKFVETISKTSSDIVICNYYSFSGKKGFRKRHGMKYENTVKAPSDMCQDLFQMTIGAPWNKFYRMSFVKDSKVLFQDTINSNDIFFTRITSAVASKIAFIDDCLIYYRVNNGNSLQGNVNKSATSYASACIEIIKELKKRNLFDVYKQSLYQYAIDLCMSALERVDNAFNLSAIFTESKKVLDECGVTSCIIGDLVSNLERRKVLGSILNNHYSEMVESLLFYEKTNSISKYSIEYRIGRRVLSSLRVKKYADSIH